VPRRVEDPGQPMVSLSVQKGHRPDRPRPDRLPTWANGRSERRCAAIDFAHVGKPAGGAEIAPSKWARWRSRAPPGPMGRPARHGAPCGLPGGVGGDPPAGGPARLLAVPGLWPRGRPRGPPRRQARPGRLGLRSRPPGRTLSALPYPNECPYARGRLVITPLGAGIGRAGGSAGAFSASHESRAG